MSSAKEVFEALHQPVQELADLEGDEELERIFERTTTDDVGKTTDEVDVGRKRLFTSVDLDLKYRGEVVSSKDIFRDDEITGFKPRRKKKSLEIGSGGSMFRSQYNERDEEVAENEDEEITESEDGQMTESEGEEGTESDSAGSSGIDTRSMGSETQQLSNVEDDVPDEDETILKIPQFDEESRKRKGEFLRQQLAIWDQQMFLLIKVHAALRAFNQLPRGKLANTLSQNASEEVKKEYHKVRRNSLALVRLMFELEDVLLKKSTLTSHLFKGKKPSDNDSDNESITSSEDENRDGRNKSPEDGEESEEVSDANYEESDCDMKKESKSAFAKTAGRVSRQSIAFLLKKRHERFDSLCKEVIAKCDERTRLGLGTLKKAKNDFSGFESQVLSQIAQIMSDKPRLIRRTQTKRSDIDRLGGNAELLQDVEIFDDDDFYQQLLKDLIDNKAQNVNDPIEMSRQWLAVQNLRQKRTKKKKVDTKASKGRKIRYVAIPKLLNFQPSMPDSIKWSHETRNQLFSSLFQSV
ncbi:hypothetical protein AB6A40_000104 [Gnathostoma spinigerum]|uniref:Apoptosis antagonizing transcription factor n=1 Tax=Gnathostoma spinigerum TaxID=75299 RepID=A0ABD6EAR6_9BILA